MKKETLKALFICGHQWTRELVNVYNDINYKTQFGMCIRELIRQKKNGEHNLF